MYKRQMFASILISGIELITKEPIGSREITIISVAIGLGYGLGATTGATSVSYTHLDVYQRQHDDIGHRSPK